MSSSGWIDAVAWMQNHPFGEFDQIPPELPPLNSRRFWDQASQLEMQHRAALSMKILKNIETGEPAELTPLESWLCHRRVEWAAQLILANVRTCIPSPSSVHEILKWALVESWQSDGCIAFWNHVERGGRPHPDNPEGLSEL